jgi:Protein of unknown function (DUF3078)
MGKLFCLTMLCMFCAIPGGADEWQKSADITLNLNQASYSDSWTGGESGTLTWTAIANMLAEKALSERYHSRNEMKLSFGQTHSEEEDADGEKYWAKPEKTTDRIFFESVMKMTFGAAVDPFASLTLESQFYDSRDPENTFMLNPLTLTESIGAGRTFFKTEEKELMSRLGFSVRQHIIRDVDQLDDEKTETTTINDGGIEWVTDYSHAFDQMKYVSKLRVFKALYNSESEDLKGSEMEDYWEAPDVAWENTLSAQVSKYIQVSLFCELLYDKELDVRGRFRETLGLGLTYKLY